MTWAWQPLLPAAQLLSQPAARSVRVDAESMQCAAGTGTPGLRPTVRDDRSEGLQAMVFTQYASVRPSVRSDQSAAAKSTVRSEEEALR
jgi:hypothetical protein